MIDFAKRHWFVGLIVLSILLHAIGLLALRPWAQTRMRFDREAEQQRAALVAHREEQRKQMEHERRQQTRLPKEHAERLKQQEEAKRRDILRENVLRLAQAREKVVREREQAFERLEKRTEKELLPHRIERLLEQLRKANDAAHQVTREDRYKDEADAMKRDLEQALQDGEQMKKQVEHNPDAVPDLAGKAAEIAETADRLAVRYREMAEASGGSMKFRAQQASRAVDDLQREARRQAAGVRAGEMNDTRGAEPIGEPPATVAGGAVAPDATPADLYDAAVELEKQIDRADQQARAAELAVLQGSSLSEAGKRMGRPAPPRPDLTPTLRQGDSAAGADGESGVATVGDLNAYREAIATATHETTDMARRASRQADGTSPPTAARSRAYGADSAEARRLAALERLSRTRGQSNYGLVVDLTSLQLSNWQGGGGDESLTIQGLRAEQSGRGGEMIGGSGRQNKVRLKESTVVANALPGRMLTEQSARKGFLFLDTWYFIGPWDNWSRADFELVHPPEQRIDLDARYYDGKFADRANHPDHILRWQFVQSDRIAIQPPRITYSATWYAYTEVYSDRTREMLVAVASDDMAKVWLNGDVIWTDVGQSSWNLDEGFRKVIFTEGFNTILVRVENGPAYCAFSVLLCPPEVLAGLES